MTTTTKISDIRHTKHGRWSRSLGWPVTSAGAQISPTTKAFWLIVGDLVDLGAAMPLVIASMSQVGSYPVPAHLRKHFAEQLEEIEA